MRHLLSITICLSAAAWAQTGLAFFDAEVFYGSRTSSVKYVGSDGGSATKDLKGTDIGANFLLDPIPLVPIAFGVTTVQGSTNYDDLSKVSAEALLSDPSLTGGTSSGTGTSTAMFYGPMVKVWIPVPKAKPYIKAAFLLGAETVDQKLNASSASDAAIATSVDAKAKTVYTHSASEITLGVSYSPLTLTSVFAEYTMHSGKRKAKSMGGTASITAAGQSAETVYTDADLDSNDKKETDANSKSIRFGVSVGI